MKTFFYVCLKKRQEMANQDEAKTKSKLVLHYFVRNTSRIQNILFFLAWTVIGKSLKNYELPNFTKTWRQNCFSLMLYLVTNLQKSSSANKKVWWFLMQLYWCSILPGQRQIYSTNLRWVVWRMYLISQCFLLSCWHHIEFTSHNWPHQGGIRKWPQSIWNVHATHTERNYCSLSSLWVN